jgi:hypothetical protein
MVEGQPKEQPPIWITPAQPFRYDPENGLFCGRQQCDSLSETKFHFSRLKFITNLDLRADQYPKSQLDCETGLLLGPGASLIELPNLRKALAEAHSDEQRRITINQEVIRIMRNVYETLNPPDTQKGEQQIDAPLIKCVFDEYGVFELQVGEVGLFARPNSYAVYTPQLLVVDDKHGHHVYFPNLSADQIMKNTDAPLAYSRNNGPEAAGISLLAGAGALASLVKVNPQSSSAVVEEIAA